MRGFMLLRLRGDRRAVREEKPMEIKGSDKPFALVGQGTIFDGIPTG
jgi:hypothetical protein